MRVGWYVAISSALVACGRIGFDPNGDAMEAPEPRNVAFVTSSVQAPALFGGLAGADAVCEDRAVEAGLAGRFVAYLSTSVVNAPDRLAGARGWYRVDGAPLVDTPDDLVNVLVPLRIDEHGRDVVPDVEVVTTGTYAGMVNQTCGDYTDPLDVATAGQANYAGGGFSNLNAYPCSMPTRLACFQVDYNLPLTFTPAIGRRAFVSGASFLPSSGIAAADAICTTEAQNAGFTGTFSALLPTTAPAAQRFDASGPPWVRRDGIALARTAADFLAGRSLAQLNVQADGAFAEEYVETGGYAPIAPVDPLRNCDTWTNPNGGNAFGHATASDVQAFTQTTSDCMTAVRVYCLEH